MKTVKRALIDEADKKYNQPKRGSLVDAYEDLMTLLVIGEPPVTSLPVTRHHLNTSTLL